MSALIIGIRSKNRRFGIIRRFRRRNPEMIPLARGFIASAGLTATKVTKMRAITSSAAATGPSP
jgi:hypothetical protein